MITVETMFERLARGPLKNMSAVSDTNLGEITPEYQATMMMLLNEGLREISTKKLLVKERVKITWVDNQADYVLAETNVGDYLTEQDDSTFSDDRFVRVLNIYTIDTDDADSTRIVADSGMGISTPRNNVLRVTSTFRELYTEGIRITYQARHVEVTELSDEIDIPKNLEYALQMFIASQYISGMSGPEHVKRGDELRAKFLQEMGEDEAKNLSATSDMESDTRFSDRGFV